MARLFLGEPRSRSLEWAKVPLDHLVVVALEGGVEQRLLAPELGVETVAVDAEMLHEHLRRRAGEAVVNLIRNDIKPLDIMTRKAFENAISVVIALGVLVSGLWYYRRTQDSFADII